MAIVDNGLNITAAADRLYTSQPGVSKQRKLLEEELGMQLFARRGKSLHRITRAGEQVISRARVIMAEVDQIRSVAANFYQEEEGVLTVAATNTQARYVLPDILRQLRQQYPKVTVNLHQGTSEQIAGMLSRNDVDFAIASGSGTCFDSLLQIPAYQWDRIVLVPNDHQLARIDRPVTLHDIVKFPLIRYVFSFEGDQSLQETFSAEGLSPNIVFTARDSDVVKTYVRMGISVGVVAGMAYEPQDRKNLTAIRVKGIFPRSTAWVGIKRNTMLRCYMTDFLQLFAPHLSSGQNVRAARATSQQEIDSIVMGAGLPVRNGISAKLLAAA